MEEEGEQEGEIEVPPEFEDIVEQLLCGLTDKDTVVRWSAGKGEHLLLSSKARGPFIQPSYATVHPIYALKDRTLDVPIEEFSYPTTCLSSATLKLVFSAQLL